MKTEMQLDRIDCAGGAQGMATPADQEPADMRQTLFIPLSLHCPMFVPINVPQAWCNAQVLLPCCILGSPPRLRAGAGTAQRLATTEGGFSKAA